jgi:hypothetical protein
MPRAPRAAGLASRPSSRAPRAGRRAVPAAVLAAFFTAGLLLAGCADPGGAQQAALDSVSGFPGRFTAPIEAAHADSVWQRRDALAAGLTVRFGGQTRLRGQMLMSTNAGRARLKLGGDTVAVFDGEAAWVAPDSAALPRARLNLLTWPYFAAAPHKLDDPGTQLERRGRMPVRQAPPRDDAAASPTMPAARLTFAAGTGDSPDDWYMLYRDPQTNRLAAMGYVVTYGAATAESATPHAIVYSGYQSVEGVPLPTAWTFYNWSEAKGPHGEPTGRVTLRDPRFVSPPDSAFAPPAGAERVAMPADT